MFDRQKKKNLNQTGLTNGYAPILMRGEIMSAGQANVAQRKHLTAASGIPHNETNL